MAARKGGFGSAPETPGWVESLIRQMLGGSGGNYDSGSTPPPALPPTETGLPSWLPWALIGAAAVWFLFLRKGR